MTSAYSPVRKLLATDQVDAFDCGQVALNQLLQRHALVNQKANSAQTYVCCNGAWWSASTAWRSAASIRRLRRQE